MESASEKKASQTAWECQTVEWGAGFNWDCLYRRNLLDWLMMYSTGESRVLDVGCLNGQYIAKMRALGYAGHYKGLDIAPTFIDRARKENHAERFEVGNVHNIPEEDASFDIVVCAHLVDHLYHIERPMAELCRVSSRYVILGSLHSKGDGFIHHDHDFVNHNYSIAEIYAAVPKGWRPVKSALFVPEWNKNENIFQGIWEREAK